MRLIDGDAFAEFLKDAVKRQKYEDIKIDGLLTVADVIEAVISELDGTSLDGFKNNPTIDPQRIKGRWIDCGYKEDGDFKYHVWRCSECGDEIVEVGKPQENFCAMCGADMRGEDDA